MITGLVFEPMDNDVSRELASVESNKGTESLARVDLHPECEAALNEQINVEYSVSYIYHSLYAFFDRDNVGLPGFAKHFKEAAEEEREHAEKLMEYMNIRGGKVKLQPMSAPQSEFDHKDKGEALFAMELSLALEKLNYQKLMALHAVGDKHGDAQLCDFVESDYLGEQVEDIKKASIYVSQLRRVGKGLGVFQFDQEVLGGEA
jgi:ferritin heavy chain